MKQTTLKLTDKQLILASMYMTCTNMGIMPNQLKTECDVNAWYGELILNVTKGIDNEDSIEKERLYWENEIKAGNCDKIFLKEQPEFLQ